MFTINAKSSGQVLKYVGYDLLTRYGLIHKFKVKIDTDITFLKENNKSEDYEMVTLWLQYSELHLKLMLIL